MSDPKNPTNWTEFLSDPPYQEDEEMNEATSIPDPQSQAPSPSPNNTPAYGLLSASQWFNHQTPVPAPGPFTAASEFNGPQRMRDRAAETMNPRPLAIDPLVDYEVMTDGPPEQVDPLQQDYVYIKNPLREEADNQANQTPTPQAAPQLLQFPLSTVPFPHPASLSPMRAGLQLRLQTNISHEPRTRPDFTIGLCGGELRT